MIRTTKDNIFEMGEKIKKFPSMLGHLIPGHTNSYQIIHDAWPIYSNSFLNNPLFSLYVWTWERQRGCLRLSSCQQTPVEAAASLYRMKTNLLLLHVKTSVAKPFWRAALFAANNILPKRFILLHWVFFFSNSLQPPVYSRNLWMYSLLL
jgi:hypothetical protein